MTTLAEYVKTFERLSYLDRASFRLLLQGRLDEDSLQGGERSGVTLLLGLLNQWNLPTDILLEAAKQVMPHTVSRERPWLSAPLVAGPLNPVNGARQGARASEPYNIPVMEDHSTSASTVPSSLERLRQIFLVAYLKPECALFCLASHIARLNTTETSDERVLQGLTRDSNNIFLPLAEMLGMWQVRRELGEQSIELYQPERLKALQEDHAKMEQSHRARFELIRSLLAPRIESVGVAADIRLHMRHLLTLYQQRLHRKDMRDMFKHIHVDVVVRSETPDCALARAEVLAAFGRSGHSYDDRETLKARFNGFRELTATRTHKLDGEEVLLTVHIFTEAMESVNNYGVVAARFRPETRQSIEGAWWETDVYREFAQAYPGKLSPDEIHVLSPLGQLFALPKESTPVDFAYAVHSEVGNHCTRMWVNGSPSAYDKKLQNGDMVKVAVDLNYPGPPRRWSEGARTSLAKSYIRQALAERQTQQGPEVLGEKTIKGLLKRELEAHALHRLLPSIVEQLIESTYQYFGYSDITAMYHEVGLATREGKVGVPSAQKIVAHLISYHLAGLVTEPNGDSINVPLENVRLMMCSDPKCGSHRVRFGDPIVGQLVVDRARHRTLTIYRQDCQNAPTGAEAIKLAWRVGRKPGDSARIVVEGIDKARLLEKVLGTIYGLYDDGLYLHESSARVTDELVAHMEFVVSSSNYQALQHLETKLQQMKDDEDIYHLTVYPLSPARARLLVDPHRLLNPYTLNPVRDDRLFVGRRKEIRRIVETIEAGNNLVAVKGTSRIGKSSILLYMHDNVFVREKFVPVYIDVGRLSSFTEEHLWGKIADEILNAPGLSHALPHKKNQLHTAFKVKDRITFAELLNGLSKSKKLLGEWKLVVLVDEMTQLNFPELWPPEEAALVLSRLGVLAGEKSCAFVLSVHDLLYRSASRKELWADLIGKSIPVSIDLLEVEAARKLIEVPLGEKLEYDSPIVDVILQQTACHPYYLQIMLYEIVTYMKGVDKVQYSNVVTHQDFERVLGRLAALGEHNFLDFLQHTGPAGRTVMTVLASVSGHASNASLSTVRDALRKRNVEIREGTLFEMLDQLCDHGAVRRTDNPTDASNPSFSIRIPLFANWLLKRQSLNTARF